MDHDNRWDGHSGDDGTRQLDRGVLRWAMELRRVPEWLGLAFSLSLVMTFGVADYLTGEQVTVALLFLVPIGIATWTCRPRTTMVVAGAAGLAGLGARVALADGEVTAVAVGNFTTRTGVYLTFAYVGLLLHDLVDQLETQATHDGLTRLRNRRAFFEVVEKDRRRAARTGRGLSILYLDLDNLKEINDAYGHETGDVLLVDFARRLQESLRPGDQAARMGGDEFAVVLSDTDAVGAAAVVTRLQEALAAPSEQGLPVSVSIGCATFREVPDDVDVMVHVADQLMYEAKRDRRGSVRTQVLPDQS